MMAFFIITAGDFNPILGAPLVCILEPFNGGVFALLFVTLVVLESVVKVLLAGFAKKKKISIV